MEEAIEMIEADAIKRGLQKGLRRGLQEGKKEGIKEAIKNIINNMLQKGMEIEEIKELTGATKREIEQIKKQLNKE